MKPLDKIMFARNELENVTNELQKKMGFTEDEMLIVIEMVLSSARHKTIVRNGYDNLLEKKEQDNGNTNEKGQ